MKPSLHNFSFLYFLIVFMGVIFQCVWKYCSLKVTLRQYKLYSSIFHKHWHKYSDEIINIYNIGLLMHWWISIILPVVLFYPISCCQLFLNQSSLHFTWTLIIFERACFWISIFLIERGRGLYTVFACLTRNHILWCRSPACSLKTWNIWKIGCDWIAAWFHI